MRPSITGDNRKITIYDIAAEAGVSASTVSRVLTGSARVNETKKEQVLAAVEKYSFTPNALAKGPTSEIPIMPPCSWPVSRRPERKTTAYPYTTF